MSKNLAISYERAWEKLNKWHTNSSVLLFRSVGDNFGSMFPARLRHIYPDRVILDFETESTLAPSSGFVSLSDALSYEVEPEANWMVDSLIIRFPLDSYVEFFELREGRTPDEWPDLISDDLL
jgi:hypothetical protein